jgi:hypothetical protein
VTLSATRLSLHAVAEHVLCAARYAAVGRIGLTASAGGFATPAFGPDQQVLAVVGTSLVRRIGGSESSVPLTTIGELAAFAGITPGAPVNVFTPTTPLDPAAALTVDADDAARLAAWWELGTAALVALSAEIGLAAEPTLWPEHFDVGIRAEDVNYGVSPGDSYVPVPYLYVGPDMSSVDSSDPFWDKPFGATVTDADVPDIEAALAFFRDGRRRAAPSPGTGG